MSDVRLSDRFRLDETLVGEGPVRTYRAYHPDGRLLLIRAVQADPARAQEALATAASRMGAETPDAARLTDAGTIAGGYFVARDWAQGETLESYLKRAEVTPESAARVVSDALARLGDLHRAGVVHGDIRPNSVIIDEAGTVALVDAGLPAASTRRDDYTSPEEQRGEAPTPASDIYRMGLVLCRAISGSLPFRTASAAEISAAHLEAAPAAPSSLSAIAPPELDAVVLTALAKAPAERYPDADSMREALDAALKPVAPMGALPVEPAPKSKMWIWATVAVVAVLALAGAAWYFFVRVPQVPAPKVTGMMRPAAETAITSAGLKVGTVSIEPTLGVAPGTVTSQTPAPGQQAAEGTAVDLKVAAVPAVDVPKVIGDTQDAATAKLAQVGLRIGDITYVYDAKVQPGHVATQSPASGTTATVGFAVALTVSKGEQLGKVPNTVGLDQSDAVSVLTAAGLKSKVATASSASVPAGTVISQAPVAAAPAVAGTTVNLTVSIGAPATPKATVPNVVGMGVLKAIGDIRAAGLKVAIAWVPSDAAPLTVASQDPAAGSALDKGSQVTISITLPKFLLAQPQPATTAVTPTPSPAATTSPAPAAPAPAAPATSTNGTTAP